MRPVKNMTSLRIELFVNDFQKSLAFYNEVLKFNVVESKEGYISISNGSIKLGLGLIWKLPQNHCLALKFLGERKGVGVEFVIEVDDIHAYYLRALTLNYPVHEPLQKREWGLTDFRLVDPDGYYLRITSEA